MVFHWQYQNKAEPVFVPPTIVIFSFQDVIITIRRKTLYKKIAFLDFEPVLSVQQMKWFLQRPEKIFDKKRLQYLYPSFSTDNSTYFVRARGFIRGLNKDTNTGIGTRGHPIVGLNKDTNTGIGTRGHPIVGLNKDTNTQVGVRNT